MTCKEHGPDCHHYKIPAKRLTPEREQDLRDSLSMDGIMYPPTDIDKLLSEIDVLREEIEYVREREKDSTNCMVDDYELLEKERDQLKAENQTLKKCLLQMQEVAKDSLKIREECEKRGKELDMQSVDVVRLRQRVAGSFKR